MKNEEYLESLKATARDAPRLPGVYLWKDAEGQIIYIGKAKSLKDRLVSYFSSVKDAKTATLVRRAKTIETIIVANEYEALLLENTLIKQHSPRYNIDLKDGKTYPVIRITHEDFPRVFRTRRIIDDKSLYYGPFTHLQNVDAMLEIIDKLFPLRKCRTIRKKQACMYYHIGRCKAPCCGKITREEYCRYVERVQQLLSGETDPLIIEFTEKMHEAARALQFEWAAQLRNAIRAIETLTGEDSAVVDMNPENRDYITWATEGVLATFTVFSMRDGKMTGRDLYRTRSAADEWESLELFITTYYDSTRPPPPKIYLQNGITQRHEGTEEEKKDNDCAPLCLRVKNFELVLNWFREQCGVEPELVVPTEKHHMAILAMAQQNAAEDLRKRLKERGIGPALDELARVLHLPGRPERIEGFDIAQLDGKHPVASLVSFKNGVPDKKHYRYFKLRSVIGKVDDFAAMREAVQRRYSRLIRENKDLPDLILIDGGIGQVNAAKEVLDELGIAECAVVGLAKRNEELWLPSTKAAFGSPDSKGNPEPLILSRRSEALKVLQFVRDETHRFATGLNQRLRSKDLFLPTLESVHGIGKQRAAAIIKAYENIENIAAADPAELTERCRISQAAAKAVRAAAQLALEDRNTRQQQLTGQRQLAGQRPSARQLTEALAMEAAEPSPEYNP
ncbi:MAG: excinuclease ABC subunit UvrC [Treponema sp.]|nr:excinuclease ABC subunit UvrC [Treponema sp.]